MANGIDPVRKGISEALISTGASFIGSAFSERFNDPNLGKAIENAGAGVVEAMHQKWNQFELENFQNTYGSQFQEELQKTWGSYNGVENQLQNGLIVLPTGEVQEIDPASPQGRQMSAEAKQNFINDSTQLTIQFMQNAGKFANNPLISQMANNLIVAQSNWQKSLLGGYGEVIAEEKAGRESDLVAAQIETERARPELLRAQAEGKAGKELRWGFLPSNVPVGSVDTYLRTDPQGRKKLGPYLDSYVTKYKDELIKEDPTLALKLKGPSLIAKMEEARPELVDRAIGDMLRAELPMESRQALSTIEKFDKYNLIEGPAPEEVEEVINFRMTDAEAKTLITGGGFGLSPLGPQILDSFHTEIRKRKPGEFKTVEEAVGAFDQKFIRPTINEYVGKFPGAEVTKSNLRTQLRNYIQENYDRYSFLTEEFGEKPKKTKGLAAFGPATTPEEFVFGRSMAPERARLLTGRQPQTRGEAAARGGLLKRTPLSREPAPEGLYQDWRVSPEQLKAIDDLVNSGDPVLSDYGKLLLERSGG